METAALTLMNVSVSDLEDMTLLDLDERLKLIKETQRDKDRYLLKDLSCIILYGVNTAYSIAQSKKNRNLEPQFHKQMDKLLGIGLEDPDVSNPEGKAESDLQNLFGQG